jgi:hypothetical protein
MKPRHSTIEVCVAVMLVLVVRPVPPTFLSMPRKKISLNISVFCGCLEKHLNLTKVLDNTEILRNVANNINVV